MHKYLCGVALVGLIAAAAPAAATTITYTATPDSSLPFGYEFDFTVANDTLGVPIGAFSIEFGETDIASLIEDLLAGSGAPSAPGGWYDTSFATLSPLVVSPVVVPGFSSPGFYEAYASTPSDEIAPGASLGGFTVVGDLADTSLGIVPDMLYFEILDPYSFDVIDDGYATLSTHMPPDGGGGVPPVPLPATFPLLLGALGWLGLGGLRRRRANTA